MSFLLDKKKAPRGLWSGYLRNGVSYLAAKLGKEQLDQAKEALAADEADAASLA